MNKHFISRYLLLVITILSFEVAAEGNRVSIALRSYPPNIVVVNDKDELMLEYSKPTLEYRNMHLNMLLDHNSETGFFVPTSICSALTELKKLLPEEYYSGLIAGHLQMLEHGEILNDPGVSERVEDLALFLTDAWMLDKPNNKFQNALEGYDKVERFLSLLSYQKKCMPKTNNN